MKLSERFDELASEARTAARETLLGTYYEAQARAFERAAQLVAAHEKVRVVCGYCEAVLTDAPDAFAAHDTVCERNPLVKRVAELETEVVRLRSFETLASIHRATIADLDAQLAWTPVSAGLPEVDRTTRAVLVVRDAHGGAMLLEPRYHEDGEWKWCSPEFPFGIKFGDGCTWEYRRLELPKGGES